MIKVKSNIKQFTKGLDDHQKKQLPFATMKAINATLGDMRKGVISHIKDKQKSNKAWWNDPVNGINREFATKLRLIGSLFTKMPWAELQEDGGIKKPSRGTHIAIPLDRVPKSRRKAGGARTMASQARSFVTNRGIFRKAGGKSSPRTELLFWFKKFVVIRPLFGFKKTAHAIATKKFVKHFQYWMDRAIKTAK